MIHLTEENVWLVAPDQKTYAAAQKLARRSGIKDGASCRALWGEIKGSAAAPYFTTVDIRGPLAFSCTCARSSLNRPCKHVLALMLRRAAAPQYTDDEPQAVVDWLAARDERAEKQKAKEPEAPAPEGPAADKSAPKLSASANRRSRVDAGVELVQRTVQDIMRLGLGSTEVNDPKFWDGFSRRAVDAQTPGVLKFIGNARRLLQEGEVGREKLLNQLGKLALLLEAYRRIDDASEDFASEIRQALGYVVYQSEVLASGERVEGVWLALGRKVSTARLRTLFVADDWFLNVEKGRFARYLQYAGGASPEEVVFPENFSVGSFYKGAMRFWPGTLRLRALFESPPKAVQPTPFCRVKTTIDKFFRKIPEYQARAPWVQTIPAFLDDVVVRPWIRLDGLTRRREWRVVGSSGLAAPAVALNGNETALASCFGATWDAPHSLFAEWNGREFVVFSLWKGRSFFRLFDSLSL